MNNTATARTRRLISDIPTSHRTCTSSAVRSADFKSENVAYLRDDSYRSDRDRSMTSFPPECNSNDSRYSVAAIDDEIQFYYYTYKVATPTLFGLIMLTGLVGNSLVVYVTLIRPKMHSSFKLLLLNLAFSDLTFLTVCIPFMAYHFAADNWLIGEAICKLSQYILYVTVYVTVYTLVSISVLRFFHIVCAHYHHRPSAALGGGGGCRGSVARIWTIIAAIWATMLAANTPILFIYNVKTYQVPPAANDDDEKSEELAAVPPYYYCGIVGDHGKRLFVSFFLLSYVLPLLIIAGNYLSIFYFLEIRRRRSTVRRSDAAVTQIGSTADRSTPIYPSPLSSRSSYASRVFLAVVAVFGLCWLPIHAHLLLVNFGSPQPNTKVYQIFRMLCHVFAYSNACVNPFVYHYVSVDFRQSLRSVFGSVCGRFRRDDRLASYASRRTTNNSS